MGAGGGDSAKSPDVFEIYISPSPLSWLAKAKPHRAAQHSPNIYFSETMYPLLNFVDPNKLINEITLFHNCHYCHYWSYLRVSQSFEVRFQVIEKTISGSIEGYTPNYHDDDDNEWKCSSKINHLLVKMVNVS